METQRIDILNGDYNSGIEKAACLLKQGGIVAIPTETVYGLAASAYCDDAIKKVFLAKGRPQDNPLIVHICDIDMLKDVADEIPKSAYLCAEKFWPGPLTLVLKSKGSVAKSVSAGLDTVAVRMPSETSARDIIEKSGIPLAAPSANISGSPSPTTASHVIADLDGKIDGVVFGNDCVVGVESTVLSLVGEKPRLLRPGAVTVEQLTELLGEIVVDKAVLSEPESDEKVASPGMKYKHYSPKAQVYLVEGESEAFAEFVNKHTDSMAVCFSEDKNINIKSVVYGSNLDESTLAHNIFSVLRELDQMGAKKVYVHAPSRSGVGLAVFNRLIRAAAFRVIKL